MMRHFSIFLLTGVMLLTLVGCDVSPIEATLPVSQTATATPPPTAVVTLQQAGTSYPAAPTAQAEVVTPESYPAPGETDQSQSNLTSAPTIAVDISPGGQAWSDCTLAPGWMGCDPNAQPVGGRLAFQHLAGPALVALDLQSSSAWQAEGSFQRKEWSPNGDQLLVTQGLEQYVIYSADGQALEQFVSEFEPRWQPDNSLSRDGSIRSADGVTAWLEMTPELTWNLHVIQPQGAGTPTPEGDTATYRVEPQPTDRLHYLVGWVPGTTMALGQTYDAAGGAMQMGGRLYTFDILTGERRDLDAAAPMGWQASYAWHPQSPLLAVTETGGMETGLPTLALIDFTTGEIRHPLPAGVTVGDIAWAPDGQSVTFYAAPVGDIPPQAAGTFTTAAVYSLNPTTGEVQRLTTPPAGAQDGWPHWSAGGSVMVYARRFEQGVVEVRALRPADGSDTAIIAGLLAPCDSLEGRCDWRLYIAWGAQE